MAHAQALQHPRRCGVACVDAGDDATPAQALEGELEHRAGAVEWAGVGVSLLAAAALGLLALRRIGV